MIERTVRDTAPAVPSPTAGAGLACSRRAWLAGAAGALGLAAGPFVRTRRARAAGKVVVRTIGGAYEEANVKAIFEPFTKATDIEVVKVPATLGKLLAMFEAGSIELDVLDAGELGVLSLSQKGALEKIDYKAWKLTEEDWRNRDKWGAYQQAAEDMFVKTSTNTAPWHIVEGNDKHWARVKVLSTVVEVLSSELKYKAPDPLASKEPGKRAKK